MDPNTQSPDNNNASNNFGKHIQNHPVYVLFGLIAAIIGLYSSLVTLNIIPAPFQAKPTQNQDHSPSPDLTRPPHTVEPTPARTSPVPADPAWQQFSEALAASENESSAARDEIVQTLYSRLKSDSALALSDEQRHLLEQAAPISRALEESDARLEALHVAAAVWRMRKGSEAPDVSATKNNITDFDMQRLNEDGYRADWNMLQEADQLLKWSRRGFTLQTASAVPVYVYIDNTNERGRQIAISLHDSFKGILNIMDQENSAALFIKVVNARSGSIPPQQASSKWRGYTSFDVVLSWIGGALLARIPEAQDLDSAGPIDVDGRGLGEAVRINSFERAIADTHNRIIALAKH